MDSVTEPLSLRRSSEYAGVMDSVTEPLPAQRRLTLLNK